MVKERTGTIHFARIVFILCMSVTALAATANAQVVQTECQTYFKASKSAPPTEIATYFADSAKTLRSEEERQLFERFAVTRCKPRFGGTLYVLDYPVQFDSGVCHFKQSNISHLFDSNGDYLAEKAPSVGFKNHPPELMAVSDKPCPRQDDPKYISTSMVPPGVFRSIITFWALAASSEAQMQNAFSEFPREPMMHGEVEKVQEAEFNRFRNVLRGRFGSPLPVNEIRVSVNVNPEDTTHYEIWVSDPNNRGRGWVIGIDLIEDGWKFVHFTSWIA